MVGTSDVLASCFGFITYEFLTIILDKKRVQFFNEHR